jgi:hypothetical protein
MIYNVDSNSPPRYFVQGAESDPDDDLVSLKEMRSLKTAALAKDVFARPSAYCVELEIKFKNVFNRDEIVPQTLKASSVSVDNLSETITCEFNTVPNYPIFFAFNHKARYSKTTLFICGPHTNNQRKPLSIFRQYLDSSSDPDYTISSLNLQLRALLSPPTEHALRTIKPPAVRKLFSAPDEPSVIDVYTKDAQLNLGGLLQVNKVQIQIPLAS